MKHIFNKKGLVLAIIMVLAFSLVACGGNGTNSNEEVANSEVNNEIDMEEETKDVESMDEEEVKLDSNLGGIELLQSFNANRPKTMKVETEIQTLENIMTTITYIDGDKTRSETDMGEDGISVTINLPDEDTIYSYVEGNTEGTKIVGMSEEEASENEYIKDDTELFAKITNQASEDMTARVDMLDGEEVIYIEATEADEDMGEGLVKMWYSVKYAMPLKYEFISNGELMMSYIITSIEKNKKIDKNLFLPPSDVNFMDSDMGGMFDADMFDADMFDE